MKEKRLIVVPKFDVTYWWDRFEAYYAPFFDRIEAIPSINLGGSRPFWHLHHDKVMAKLADWLKEYDLVMFVDCDEFVIPNPERYQDLGDYLDQYKYDIACTFGYGVMEMPDDEPLDHGKPILEQRKHWYRDRNYDKPIITRVNVNYIYGFHKCDRVVHPDHDLILFHLRDADFVNLDKYCPQRNPRKFESRPDIMNYEQRLAACELIPDKWMGLL